jgi:hypothetical protein
MALNFEGSLIAEENLPQRDIYIYIFWGKGVGCVCVFGGTFRSGQTRGTFQKTKHSHPCAFRFRKCLLSCAFRIMKCLLPFSCDTWRVFLETLGHYLHNVNIKLSRVLPKSDSPLALCHSYLHNVKTKVSRVLPKSDSPLALCRSYGVLFA